MDGLTKEDFKDPFLTGDDQWQYDPINVEMFKVIGGLLAFSCHLFNKGENEQEFDKALQRYEDSILRRLQIKHWVMPCKFIKMTLMAMLSQTGERVISNGKIKGVEKEDLKPLYSLIIYLYRAVESWSNKMNKDCDTMKIEDYVKFFVAVLKSNCKVMAKKGLTPYWEAVGDNAILNELTSVQNSEDYKTFIEMTNSKAPEKEEVLAAYIFKDPKKVYPVLEKLNEPNRPIDTPGLQESDSESDSESEPYTTIGTTGMILAKRYAVQTNVANDKETAISKCGERCMKEGCTYFSTNKEKGKPYYNCTFTRDPALYTKGGYEDANIHKTIPNAPSIPESDSESDSESEPYRTIGTGIILAKRYAVQTNVANDKETAISKCGERCMKEGCTYFSTNKDTEDGKSYYNCTFTRAPEPHTKGGYEDANLHTTIPPEKLREMLGPDEDNANPYYNEIYTVVNKNECRSGDITLQSNLRFGGGGNTVRLCAVKSDRDYGNVGVITSRPDRCPSGYITAKQYVYDAKTGKFSQTAKPHSDLRSGVGGSFIPVCYKRSDPGAKNIFLENTGKIRNKPCSNGSKSIGVGSINLMDGTGSGTPYFSVCTRT